MLQCETVSNGLKTCSCKVKRADLYERQDTHYVIVKLRGIATLK